MPVDPVLHCSLIAIPVVTGLGLWSWVKIYISCYSVIASLTLGPKLTFVPYSLDVYTARSLYDTNVAGATFTLMYFTCH